jgi:hypothetical protein
MTFYPEYIPPQKVVVLKSAPNQVAIQKYIKILTPTEPTTTTVLA